jgi:excisionase family DNA binding protein
MKNTAAEATTTGETPTLENWRTPKELATLLALSDRTVRRAILAGKIPAHDVGAGEVPRYLIDPETVKTLSELAKSRGGRAFRITSTSGGK